jgi:hypothetical protein
MAVIEHGPDWEPHDSVPFYYKFWWICFNQHCKTQTVMPEEGKVYMPGHEPRTIDEWDDFFKDESKYRAL